MSSWSVVIVLVVQPVTIAASIRENHGRMEKKPVIVSRARMSGMWRRFKIEKSFANSPFIHFLSFLIEMPS